MPKKKSHDRNLLTHLPEGFPQPKYFIGQWVNYHALSYSAGEEVISRTYEGFVVGFSYQIPSLCHIYGWFYKLANIQENGNFCPVADNCLESFLTPIDRKPLSKKQFQKLLIPYTNKPSTKAIQEGGEEISFYFRGWICCARIAEEGWLSLIRQENTKFFPLKTFSTPAEAINYAINQVLKMAPSQAVNECLSDIYTCGCLSKAEYNNLQSSFDQGMI